MPPAERGPKIPNPVFILEGRNDRKAPASSKTRPTLSSIVDGCIVLAETERRRLFLLWVSVVPRSTNEELWSHMQSCIEYPVESTELHAQWLVVANAQRDQRNTWT